MQPIERYGVVALLFVVIAVVTVVAWGDPEVGAAQKQDGFLAAQGSAAPAQKRKNKAATNKPANQQNGGSKQGNKSKKWSPNGAKGKSAASAAQLALADRAKAKNSGVDARVGDTVQPYGQPSMAAEVVRESVARGALEDPHERRRSRNSQATNPQAATEATPVAQNRGKKPTNAQASVKERAKNAARSGTRTYSVRKGDTLSEIAQRELGKSSRWKEIVELNAGLDPRRLSAGAELLLPAGSAPSGSKSNTVANAKPMEATAPKTESVVAAGSNEYRVQSGDSLWRIAQATLGDGERWREIPPLNPGLDPNRLEIGQRIALPAGADVTAIGKSASKSIEVAPSARVAQAEKPRGRVR